MKKLVLTALITVILSATSLLAEELKENALPDSKRTSLKLYVTAADAYEQWKASPKTVKIVDVRTEAEFEQVGYPKMAIKIPLSQEPEEFVGRVTKQVSPDDTVLIICRSGNRSAFAVNMLAKAGFKKAYTVVDGFEGGRNKDPDSPDFGKRTVNGWKNAGLPWTR